MGHPVRGLRSRESRSGDTRPEVACDVLIRCTATAPASGAGPGILAWSRRWPSSPGTRTRRSTRRTRRSLVHSTAGVSVSTMAFPTNWSYHVALNQLRRTCAGQSSSDGSRVGISRPHRGRNVVHETAARGAGGEPPATPTSVEVSDDQRPGWPVSAVLDASDDRPFTSAGRPAAQARDVGLGLR